MRGSVCTIEEKFSNAASSYDRVARVQAKAAEILAEKLVIERISIQDGPILEIGCGTGLLSELLVRQFPKSDIVVADLSESMLLQCRQRLEALPGAHRPISYVRANVEDHDDRQSLPVEECGLIVSSFAMQWFLDFEETVSDLLSRMTDNTHMIFAIPIEGSFKEWRRVANLLQLPCTLNDLPSSDNVRNAAKRAKVDLQFEVRELTEHYPSARDFFRSLKDFGASTQLDEKSLSSRDFLHLMNTWDLLERKPEGQTSSEGIGVTYRILFGRFLK